MTGAQYGRLRHATALAYVLAAADPDSRAQQAAAENWYVDIADVPRDHRTYVAALLRETVDQVRAQAPGPFGSDVAAVVRALEDCPAFDALLRGPTRPSTLRPVAITMTGNRWSLPVLNDESDLAELLGLTPDRLLWLADPQHRLRRTRAGPLHPYERFWIRRGDRVPRLLEAPTPILKRAQRRLLDEVVAAIPTHEAVHGFVAGRSVLTHAGAHAGQDLVVTLDLRSFFAAVGAGRVFGLFRTAGYPRPVAHLLAGLTTTVTPVRIRAAMPPGGRVEDRFALRTLLASGHLAQGAPTSAALANAAAYRLDARLSAYAAACGMAYTRYADDLALSGPGLRRPQLARLLARVETLVREEGFTLNRPKTRVSGRSGQQRVTGLVVNERPNVARAELDQLRAVLHDAVRHGPEAANREGHPEFRAHLEGRVAWVASVDPARARRAQNLLAQVRWD